MAKKGTTGGPRKHRETAEDAERRQQYRSRAEKEQLWQRRTLIIIAVLVALSVVLLIAAIINQEVLEPRQAITTVNGEEIETRDYQARVRATRWLTANQIIDAYNYYVYLGLDADTINQQLSSQISSLQYPTSIGSQVLTEMEEELVLEQAAKDLGIDIDRNVVTEEVEDYMASYWGLTHPDRPTATPTTEPTPAPTRLVPPTATTIPTETPTEVPATPAPTEVDADGEPLPTNTPTVVPTETMTPTPMPTLEPAEIVATIAKEEDRFFDDGTETADVNEDVIRDMFYYDTLRVAVRDYLADDNPTEEYRVNARHILFAFDPASTGAPVPPTDEQRAAAEQRAEEAMDALRDGESFADLARELSDDTGSGANGGELGFANPDGYVDAFADATRHATLGEIVQVETEFGIHLIQVHERGYQALSATELSEAANAEYEAWLADQMANADIERHNDWIDRIPEEPTYNELMGDFTG